MDYENKTKEQLISMLQEKEGYISQLENDLESKDEIYYLNLKLISSWPDALIMYKNRTAVLSNDAANSMFKMDVIGRDLGDIAEHDPEVRNEVYDRVKKLLDGENQVEFIEERLILKDGSTIDCEVGGFSFSYNDDVYLVSIHRDISERKKIERLQKEVKRKIKQLDEAEQYNKLITQAFLSLSHELRTPLNIILGGIQLLDRHYTRNQSYFDSDFVNKNLKSVRQNCYRLMKLVNNFIDINKFELGFLKLNLENRNIVEIVEETTLSVVSYAKARGIKVLFDTDIEEKFFMFDADKIERVMLNLLSNAIKYTDSGGRIEVCIHDRDNKILIAVRDTGIGIPEDMKQKIFNAFIRVDSSFTRKAEGSGIGLALVRSIVELHEGTITVNSELEKGSEFIIELPVKLSEKEYEEEAVNNFRKTRGEMLSVEFSDIFTDG
ncbi:PAS domain-containing sensor histidine kinase [Clostridium swellfunianum]|uniref:PAS domain-containing sensor histidine kinase n=1 Tax=Clostridium swellfunianum TaxID=1367462 RepID=UPI00202E7ABE|nr:PAS domain-containing sensor histidine kinase [Clostridium swellfunianum]MCM0647688.1 PAS domain-containing sensor histidine kinase [Clostridium swellfunianum]